MHKLHILQLQRFARADEDEGQGLFHADVLGQNQPPALAIVCEVLHAWAVCQQTSLWGQPDIPVCLVSCVCSRSQASVTELQIEVKACNIARLQMFHMTDWTSMMYDASHVGCPTYSMHYQQEIKTCSQNSDATCQGSNGKAPLWDAIHAAYKSCGMQYTQDAAGCNTNMTHAMSHLYSLRCTVSAWFGAV